MNAQEIRERFSRYFQSKGHIKLPSSPIIPQNDPTLLFANAGMNQFKDYFTGKANAKDTRAVTIQKCVRAGGKHNDLENVGFTARHQTFFEMLGNFSFGDYFKEEAIAFAWEFLTKELKISSDKLFVTVHYSDDEAYNIWHKKMGLDENKIFKKGDKDNFWEMGEFGPCGPCSEIYFDYGEKYAKKGFTPGENQDILDDDERYVEIWNLVFMQYEKTPEGRFNLPKPSIDTGAGLERIAAAIQGKYWNYDTDLFTPIISEIEKLSGKNYSDPKYCSLMRIVADHARACTMMITDGVLPSNEGRGYVLRRIIRRAVRQLNQLKAQENSFHKLVPIVFQILGKEYPENEANAELAKKILLFEEKKFNETLELGLKFLGEAISKEVKNKTLPGTSAFKLYDSYGFPLDLTEIILKEQGLQVDLVGFDKAMQARKEDSRKSWKGGAVADTKIFYDAKEKTGATQFLGYKEIECQAKLLAVLDLGEQKGLVFDKTPFYAESGGQVGDQGVIVDSQGHVLANITDTQKPVDDLFVHYTSDDDALEEKQSYTLKINKERRELIKRNHSATHLLQAALGQILGPHVKQAGSQVSVERLRFDFTHMQALSAQEISKVENLVNQQITNALAVKACEMPKEEAQNKGAVALFGEKYSDIVRVLEMGNFSTELCGGTHVDNTSEIGLFTIVVETSLSSGTRRIEALTSKTALNYLTERSTVIKNLERSLSLPSEKIISRIDDLLNELKNKNKEIEQLKDKIQANASKDLFSHLETLGAYKFKSAKVEAGSDLKKLSDLFADKNPQGVVLLHSIDGDKTSMLLRCVHKSNLNCGKILKEALALMNGRGGGRPEMAQGSGDTDKIQKAIDYIKNCLEQAQ